jgi:molecular chaperone DnaK
MGNFIGIDVGTHQCSMAVLEGDSVHVLPGPEGDEATASCVSFSRAGVLIGKQAQSQLIANPEGTVTGIKRLMGRKFHSQEVQWLAGGVPFPVVAAPSGDAYVHLNGEMYSPEEIMSFLLEGMRMAAEKALGPGLDAVLTVPSWWDELARRAVLTAAKLAGLRVKSLINSTSAAAVMCGAMADKRQMIAVLDLGAGGFDVALANTHPGGVEVLATASDPLLGGDDIDRRLVARWLLAHRDRTGEDLSRDAAVLVWLRQRARETKHHLSDLETTEPIKQVLLTSAGEHAELVIPALTRQELTELISEELNRMMEPCSWVFDDTQLGTDDLDAVILVGGLARMPAVQEKVRAMFRKPPLVLGNADHVCALGAARFSAALQHKKEQRLDLSEVIGCSTGIRISGGAFSPVIRRNHPIPCRETSVFRTARADQERIVFDVFQGESEVAADNLYVGRFELDGLLGERNFDTTFRLDRNGLLHIALCDPRTQIDRAVPIQRAGGLTDRELAILKAHRSQRMGPLLEDKAPPTPRPERVASTTLTPSPSLPKRTKPPQTRPHGTVEEAPAVTPIEMEADSLIGTTLGDRYVIEGILGEGGMGRVYKAQHKVLEKTFAIKVLHPELASSKTLADRFIGEARAASAIKSRHVIDISDFGALSDGTGYFVMEYLEGQTLHEYLKEHRRLPMAKVIRIGIQLAEGLSDAHELDIVHRDLKPSNIMIALHKGVERVTILDFGIAKRPTSTGGGAITRSGVMVGTPEYMAPEQIQGDPVDGRADIYALGIIMYELAAGRRPFDAESQAELLMQQVYEPPRAILEVAPKADMSAELEAVIRRCLEKDPNDRYASAHELAEVLRTCRVT